MAHVSVNLQFWLPDKEAKKFISSGSFNKGSILTNLIAGDQDGSLDAQISYGELKVKMDDDECNGD